jgi:uncharacterized membrane protein YagU involved in acid resistance
MPNRTNAARSILVAGFVAGLLDIAAAIISFYLKNNQPPTKMFQFIASGALGSPAFTGGMGTAALGLLFHFLLAYIFTIAFYFIYPKIGLLSKNKIITGLVYGLLVWCIMNLVVLPLSKAPAIPFETKGAVTGMLILLFCIGLPIALFAHRFYSATVRRNP